MSLTSSPLSSLTSCLTSSNPPVYCILSFPLTETCPCRGSWTQCWSWFNLWATSPLLVFSLKAAAPSSWASSWTFMRRYISSLTLVFFPPAPVFLLKCVSDQLLPSFLYLQTGVWHVPQIWTSFNCDAASWCFLSSSVFHWPRQRGSSGLHHVQVRTPCCFCCLKINVYLSWWILLQHYDMNIIIGFITWFKKHRTSSNWSDLFLTV